MATDASVHLRRLLPAVCLLVALGCGDRERLAPGGGPDEAWTYGELRIHEVPAEANALVADTTSGSLFRLAFGGGQLTIRDIAEGPSTLSDEGAFEVTYTGSSPVELLLPHDAGDVAYLMGYLSSRGVVLEYEEPDTAGWRPLAPSALVSGGQGDTLVFELTAHATDAIGAVGAALGGAKYKKLMYENGTDHPVLCAQIESNIRAACLSLIDAIPVSRQAGVRTRVDGAMMPRLSVPKNRTAWVWTVKPQYVPFRDVVGLLPLCQIVIPDDHVGSVAHEVSHYFHHVLLEGDYVKFSWNSRPGHKIGTPGALAELVEDMAYLGEYYLNGNVNSTNPKWGSTLAGNGARNPRTTDFRDLEGMGIAVFAAHIRDENRITDFAGRMRQVPVISGAQIEKFRDCYEIVAQGTDDILELVDKLESVLATKYSQAAALPAMLQPLGWSHHVKFRVVDGSGNGVPNVEARAVCKTAQGEFFLPRRGTPTGNDGWYTLEEFFPIKSTLRVYSGSDSFDVADISIPLSRATNQELTFPNIVLDTSAEIQITSIDPPAAPPGMDVWIAGSGFGTTRGTVFFGTTPATEILAWVDHGVRVRIPDGAAPGWITVSVAVGNRTSNDFQLFIEDDLFLTLHNRSYIDLFFLAWHSYEPWDAGNKTTFSQALQHLQWDGESFSGEQREVTAQRRLRITCAGTVRVSDRRLSMQYEVADTTIQQSGTYVLHKRAGFANVPFEAINGGQVVFRAEGAAVEPLVSGPLVWSNTAPGGGQYTETHWDWSPEDNRLIVTFRQP